MKERPILFSDPMVRAILDGTKTQTRRVVKFPERLTAPGENPVDIDMCGNVSGHWSAYDRGNNLAKNWEMIKSPYGMPGDRLWVREAFQPIWNEGVDWSQVDWETGEGYAINYIATDEPKLYYDERRETHTSASKPSIHMPRWASRINLEITNIRVERLQDITLADIKAEGVLDMEEWLDFIEHFESTAPPGSTRTTEREYWAGRWDRINGKKHPWESNPWVWVVEFRRVNG